MPYIKPELRPELNGLVGALASRIVELSKEDTDFAGLLNYSITRLMELVVARKFPKFRYWHSAMLRGVLSDVADEFYRRIVAPYEDRQIEASGDVDST